MFFQPWTTSSFRDRRGRSASVPPPQLQDPKFLPPLSTVLENSYDPDSPQFFSHPEPPRPSSLMDLPDIQSYSGDRSRSLSRSTSQYGYPAYQSDQLSPTSSTSSYYDSSSSFSSLGSPLTPSSSFGSIPGLTSAGGPVYGFGVDESGAGTSYRNPTSGYADGSKPRKTKRAEGAIDECTCCGATSSPEWRRGPLGGRTLCNACGLTYNKLYPTASPTVDSPEMQMQSLRATKAQGRLRLPIASGPSIGRDAARKGVASNVESVAEAIEGMQNLQGFSSVPTYSQPSQSMYSQYVHQPMYSQPSLLPPAPNPFASRSISDFQTSPQMSRYPPTSGLPRTGPSMSSSMSVANLRSANATGRGTYSGSGSSRARNFQL